MRYTRRVGWVLECASLGKRFGTRWVFRGLSVRVMQGTLLTVRGSNGSGKSTLLRLIAGLMAPTEGQVRLGYATQTLTPCTDWLGWCATDGALYRELTAYEHLHWWATVRGGMPTQPLLMEWLAGTLRAGRTRPRPRAHLLDGHASATAARLSDLGTPSCLAVG